MSLTADEKSYLDRLKAAWADKENMTYYLEKRRQKEKDMKPWEFKKWLQSLQNIGAGAIQAGGELAVGLPGQLTRLAPGNQSANPNSLYNKSRNLLNSTKEDMKKEGVDTEWLAYGFGKGVMNIAGWSIIGWGIWNMAWKSSLLTWAWNTLSKSLLWRATVWGVSGATQWLWFDLASGNTPWIWTVWWAALGFSSPILWAGIKAWVNKLSWYAQKVSNQINKSKVGAYTENAVNAGKNLLTWIKDTASTLSSTISRIPSNIKTNVATQKATQEIIKKLPNKLAQTAVKDGVEIADAQMLPKVVWKIKPQARELLKAAREFELNPRGTNPIEIVGRPITKKIQQLEKTRQVIGKKLWEIADKSLGNVSKQEAVPMVFRELKKVQWLNWLKLDKKMQLDFADTVLATKATASDRKAIQSIFNDAINTWSWKSKHLLRQEIFEILDGKKKSLQTLTGTQEKAYDAIRKGLSNILEGNNSQYKAVSNEYRKVIQPLAEIRKFMKSLPDATEDILDMKWGLLARRLTSNAASNPTIRQLLRNLDKAIPGKTTESVEAMQDLYNILDKYYNIAGKTGFKWQVQAGIEWSIKGNLANAVKNFAGQSEAVTKKAFDDLIDDLLR